MHTDISSRFNYNSLFRFVLPSIVMMIFISTYTMVDGYFVSNYVGKTAFTAVNLIFPAIMVFACVGFMFGSGGSALVAKTMGEEQMEKANRLFSLIVLSAFAGAYCFPPWVTSSCPFLPPPWVPPEKCLHAVSFTAAHFFFPSPCLSSSGCSNHSWSPQENLLSVFTRQSSLV